MTKREGKAWGISDLSDADIQRIEDRLRADYEAMVAADPQAVKVRPVAIPSPTAGEDKARA